MVDASPTMSAARLSRVIEKQTGVPQGSFSLYYGSRPISGTLAESGVASGSTIELKSRGRGGGPEPQASSSAEVEIDVIEPQPDSQGRQTSGSVATEGARGLFDSDSMKELRKYDRDGDGKFSRDEMRAIAADFIKEKKTRRLATKAAIVMGVLILLVVAMNAGLTAAIVFLSKDIKVADRKLTDMNDKEVMVGSTDTMVNDEGELADRKHGTALKTAESEQELALDSRLPDSAWTELRHATFKSRAGGLLHVQVQVRCVCPRLPLQSHNTASPALYVLLAGRLTRDRRERVAWLVRQNSHECRHNHTRWPDSHFHRWHGGRVRERGLRGRVQAAAAAGRI